MKDKDTEQLFELYTESKSSKAAAKKKADLDKDGKVSKYEKKRADKVMKNDKDKSNDEHVCALEVEHRVFGKGSCIFAEHAEPDQNGYVSWYTVAFDHGRELVNTRDVTVLKETNHGNH